jgi:hypothetical protein
MNVRRRWKQTSLPNKLLVTTGALVAFGTIFYAIAAVVQICILEETVRQNKAALDASIEISQNDQRPWVAIESMTLTLLEASQPLKTEVGIKNTGKTIALDLFYPGAVQTSETPLDVEAFIRSTYMPPFTAAMTAGALFQDIGATIPAQTSVSLNAEQVEAIKARKLLVYLFGDIHYKDIFNKDHTTQYCGIYVPTTNKFEDCGQHHSAD